MKHIAITKQKIDGAEVNSINSRDLHKNLGVKTDYSKWATRLIEKYDFTENEDYLTVVKKDGRQISTDYIFSIDMAKEVCMVANTPEGRETRKFFISVEKQYNNEVINSISDMVHKTKFLLESNEIIGETISSHDKRLSNLEKNTRLEAWQEKALQDAKNKKVYELAKDDKAMANKLHRKVWQLFKNRFHLPRYSELRVGQYEAGLEYINGLTLSDMVG